MYSGLVLTKYSGRVMGTHQKIDRVARKHLAEIIDNNDDFPSIKELLEFEGKNGPDGIKRKSPSYNEPWHFLNPLANDNSNFMKLLDTHYTGLVKHLKDGNHEACAFEASWLAHAIVDGLTPAHHYPYDEKLSEMLVDGKEGRNSIKTKLLFMGETKLKTLQNTYKAYGPRGLMTAHVAFEYGVALLIKPLGLPDARPVDTDFDELEQWGYRDYFMNRAKEVAVLDIYEQYLASGWTSKLSNRVRHSLDEQYLASGWTSKLSNRVRHSLLPVLVKSVTMLWYSAMKEAGKIK